jgi:uncharacterized protein (TIGR00661 family)
MKILYGVQATGNGHITRARSMATELRNADIDVDFLFSGRPCAKLFNMDAFDDYRCLPGLTFTTQDGKVRYLKTALDNRLLRLVQDINALDLSRYDLVITDFEPVSAWSARLQNKPCIGIGHQYAFQYDIPVAGNNLATSLILKYFAPAQWSLGVHWHHFDCPILPPLIEPVKNPITLDETKVLVYLPFEDINKVTQWLNAQSNKDYRFVSYCGVARTQRYNNVTLKPFSRDNFQNDLASCNGVIANAGFGLSSEALQHGKKLLIKPLHGQMEQLSNAAALQLLQLGDVMQTLNSATLADWLHKPNPLPRYYPNVAQAIVTWIIRGLKSDLKTFTRQVWSEANEAIRPIRTRGAKSQADIFHSL